jgi:hypothetical protein
VKKFLVLFLLFSFLLVEPTFAVTQENKTCKIHKQTIIVKNKKFTCLKSSKGLFWNKDVSSVVKSTIPAAPKTTKTFTPWSTTFTPKELAQASQERFIDWVNINKNNVLKNNLIVQEETTGNRLKNLIKVNELYSKIFSNNFKDGSTVVIGKDEKWVVSKLNSSGWGVSSCGESYVGITLCIDHKKNMGIVIVSDTVHYDPRNPGVDGGALLAHEYFHLVQGALTNKDPNSRIPVWFLEGTAEFVGYSVAALAMGSTYIEGREKMLSYSPPNYPVNDNAISDYEVLIGGSGQQTYIYPYHIGQVATEYIVASIGFQKILDILKDYSLTNNFDTSFKNITGIDKKDFYEKFEQVREKMGMPPTTWKIINNVNTKIK